MQKEILYSATKPTGKLTLGNYIGAIKQMTEYQDKYDSYIFIADMHAITVNQDPKELRNNIKIGYIILKYIFVTVY